MQAEQDAVSMVMSQTTLLAIEGTKMMLTLTGKGAVRIAAILAAVMKEQHKTRGAVRLAALIRSGGTQEVFTIPQEQLRTWVEVAKRYNVLYTIVKDKSDDGMIDLFVRSEDAPRINRMVERHGIILTPQATVAAEPAPEQELTPEEAPAPVADAMQMDTDQLIAEIYSPDEEVKDESNAAIDEGLKEDPSEAEFDALFQGEKPPIDMEKLESALPDPPEALTDPPSAQPSMKNAAGGNELNKPSEPSSNPPDQGNSWTFAKVRDEWPIPYPKEAFNENQRFQIYKGFQDGLSVEQVNSYAKPGISEYTMEEIRSQTRPSVMAQIESIKSKQRSAPLQAMEKVIGEELA